MNLKRFKSWLSLNESKGIIIPAYIKSLMMSHLDNIYKAAKALKQNNKQWQGNETLETVAQMFFDDPYIKGKKRQIDVYVVNDPHQNNHASFRNAYGIEINVAHVKDEELTPKWIERVFTHEMIHAIDPKNNFETFVKMGAPSYTSADKDYGKYFNHPLEHDAYTGQMVNAIITAAEKFKGTETESILRKQLEDTLKYVTNPTKAKQEKTYGIIGDPEYWKIYHMYYLHGSPVQKRKTQQRIYNSIIQAKKILDSGE